MTINIIFLEHIFLLIELQNISMQLIYLRLTLYKDILEAGMSYFSVLGGRKFIGKDIRNISL